MRPTKIIISAFGPYVNKTEIDMSKLGDSGLFLVTGDTGAGKTTIFDAITFALFGKASGKSRDTSMLRSKYSDGDTPTFVYMEFLYMEKLYKVTRNPEYIRNAKRGDGLVSQKADAELTLPEGSVISGYGAVTVEIEKILGVSFEQFSQISMIAQGDFLSLITDTTKKRSEMFRKIFLTETYVKWQEKLKIMANGLKNSYDSIKEKIENNIKLAHIDESDSFEDDYAFGYLNITEKIREKAEEDKKVKMNLEKDLADIEKRIEELNVITVKAEKNAQIDKSVENLENLRNVDLKKLEALKDELNLSEEREKEVEKLKLEIERQKNGIKFYDEFEEFENKIKSKLKEFEGLRTDILKAKEKINNLASRLEVFKKESERTDNSGAMLKECEAKIEGLKKRLLEVEEFKKLCLNFERSEAEFKKAKNDYEIFREKKNSLGAVYAQKENAFFDAQAGIMASRLKDGEMCPVCGSKNHPQKAGLPKSAPSEDELNRAKKEYENASAKLSEKSEISGKAFGVYSSLKSSFEKGCPGIECGLDVALAKTESDRILKEIEAEIVNMEAEAKKHRADNELREQYKNKIPELEERISKGSLFISEKERLESGLRAEISGIEEMRDKTAKNLEFESKNKALENINILSEKKNQLEILIKKLKDEYAAIDTEIKANEAKIKALVSQKEIVEDFDINEIYEEKELYLKNKKVSLDEINKINIRISENLKIYKIIKPDIEALKSIEKNLSVVKPLSDTANGLVSGKDRITLETYIQTSYFEMILNRANTRLMIMTNGQYEFKRRENADNFRSKSGLDIDVIDHYNSSIRSVKTLSGGESFKAALSLALGFSEQVQSSCGGIKLDTMFVDEGFGSLDSQSLEQAVNALMSIGENKRAVGIISHVSELKERIDKQIVVKKDRIGGSYVEIIN